MADDGRTVVLRHSRDKDGSRYLGATLAAGLLRIEGQDLGPGVEAILGAREYEWTWTVAAAAIPAAVDVLGGAPGSDPLTVLAAWSSANGDADPGQRLRDAGLAVEFWSRIGD
ncbi:MAG TPA: hypothetical protein VIZ22_10360 [Candidatus Limnocylindrales bacterium]